MKATRKLIPAFAMLLIAAVMMSTATFAWFTTNADVSAGGFGITAKADNVFLVISENPLIPDPNDLDDEGNPVIDEDELNSKQTDITTVANGTGIIAPARLTLSDSNTTALWETSTSDEINVSTSNGSYTDVASNLGNYTVKKTLYIRTAQGFPSATNLILESVFVNSKLAFAEAVSVAIRVNGTTWYDYENCGGAVDESDNPVAKTMPKTSANVLAELVNPGEDITLEIYFYINGEHESVTTENATEENLQEMEVTLVFASVPDDDLT